MTQPSGPFGALAGLGHVAVGAQSPIPGSAALLARARSGGALRVSMLGSEAHSPFTDGGRELFDCAAQGRIDAFFWSGGVPTPAVGELAAALPIRLVDLDEDGVLAEVRHRHPVYTAGTVPAQSYAGLTVPITTMLVRNFLLVGAAMPEPLAAALLEVLFTEQEALAQAGPATLAIDPRAAIGTDPVALHPGAAQFYRDERG